MLFNSIDFLIFFPIVFGVYWIAKGQRKWQNLIILISSYVFYGWWDYRFLSLIVFSTLIDYFVGKRLSGTTNQRNRKLLLATSILVNIGLLGFFKYYDFFIENFIAAFSLAGLSLKSPTLNIILPVGISFYTFQTLSYTIDVYRNKIPSSRDFVDFAAYVAFFPQLVAGPIERASRLLPQFAQNRQFNYAQAVDGMRQILWGFFKKVVIADNCATYVEVAFGQTSDQSPLTLALGALFFTIQIYGDFSGYSDMAIGLARLLGFNLMQNFAYPFFSRDIPEFWRRWHISLSTWFRDYVYIPLGGSKGSLIKQIRNVLIVFIVSGFWHGANWTFIVWGLLNAIYFLPYLLLKQNRNHLDVVAFDRSLPTFRELIQILITFAITVLAFVFFRAENLTHAFDYLMGIIDPNQISLGVYQLKSAIIIMGLTFLMMAIEWKGRTEKHALANISRSRVLRWTFYIVLIFIIGMFMQTDETPFIYFQF